MTTIAVSHKRATRFLRFTESAALIYGAIAGGIALMFAFAVLSSSFSSGGGSAIQLPVGANPATLATGLSGNLESNSAHFTMVEFTAIGLSPTASLLYFAPRVLIPLLHSIVAFSIARFALSARRERPFNDNLTQSIAVVAWSVAVLGMLSQVFFNYGTSLARNELLGDTEIYAGWLTPSSLDWTPLLSALALFAVIIVLRVGERMQRDTEGLI